MPFKTSPNPTAFRPTQDLPHHLDHKPVYALPYQAFDGDYEPEKTDVQFVTVGIAQYDPDEISVKTMRHTGSKWTRQAEELPLHRPIDMTLFLAKVIFDADNGIVNIKRGTMCHQESDDIEISKESLNIGETAVYDAAVQRNIPLLKKRLDSLLNVLTDLKNRGKF